MLKEICQKYFLLRCLLETYTCAIKIWSSQHEINFKWQAIWRSYQCTMWQICDANIFPPIFEQLFMLHFPRTNVIGIFPRGRFFPSSTIVFTFMCARQYFWTFGLLCIFGVFNNQIHYSTNLCFIDLIVVALWNRPQVDAVCPASRDPNQASRPSISRCECFKEP